MAGSTLHEALQSLVIETGDATLNELLTSTCGGDYASCPCPMPSAGRPAHVRVGGSVGPYLGLPQGVADRTPELLIPLGG
jgi:hypothetical protein